MNNNQSPRDQYLLESRPSWLVYPSEFLRMIDMALTQLEPWQILKVSDATDLRKGLRTRFSKQDYVPLARRSDRDDVAVWSPDGSGNILIVHDYSRPGTERREQFDDFRTFAHAMLDECLDFEGDLVGYR